MKLLSHLNHALHHLPWQEADGPPEVPTGSFVVAVALVSVAAAAVLILNP